MQPDHRALQTRAQRCRCQLALRDALRQPRLAPDGARQADQHDGQPKDGADAGDGDWHQKNQRQKDGEQHQTVGANGLDDVVQAQMGFGQRAQHALNVLHQGFGDGGVGGSGFFI